jgi:hypothetical protein
MGAAAVMSFLAPLFLLGGLAVGLPLLFHLTRRSTRQRQVFSTLMFLRPTPPRLTRRNRVEHILLLLLRCGVIGLLAFAFARPFFRESAAVVPPVTPPQRWVLLLDTSASLRRDGLWAAAEAEYRRVLDELDPGDELAVMTFDREIRTVLSFEQWRGAGLGDRRVLALERFGQTKPGWAGTRLDLGLLAAAELLNEEEALANEAVSKRIRVITDLQAGAQLSALQGYNWPAGIEVVPQLVRPSAPGNAGIQWVAATESDWGGDASEPTAVRVRVTNATDSRRDQFEVRWGEGDRGEPMRVQVPPGQSRVFGLPVPAGAGDLATLRLAGDDHEFDNTVHILGPQVTERRVWFWTDDRSDDPKRLGYYLERAFPTLPRRKTELRTVAADAEWQDTEKGQALVIATGAQSSGRIAAARKWVSDGGTLLWVLTDAAGGADGLRALIAFDSITVTEAGVDNYALLERIDFRHPLFAPFADPRYSDFTKIHFWRHRRVEFGGVPGVSVLARFDGGDPALIELPLGSGRVLVLAAGWHPADGQLALSSKFVPWLHALVEYAAGAPAQPSQHYVGDLVALAASNLGPVTVARPDGTVVESTDQAFRQTDLPGSYRVSQGTNEWRFAVNLEPAETRTGPMAPDDLERLGVPLRAEIAEASSSGQPARQRHEAEIEGRQKLWRWLILGALVLLGVESWLAGRLTRGRVVSATG